MAPYGDSKVDHGGKDLVKLQFENYMPRSEDLKKCTIPNSLPHSLIDTKGRDMRQLTWQKPYLTIVAHSAIDRKESSEASSLVQEILEAQEGQMKAFEKKFADPSMDLDNMVPRKGHWDMKRALAPKIERLERRTRRTIIRLVEQKQIAEGKIGTGKGADVVSSDED